jgi:hypothetical protein
MKDGALARHAHVHLVGVGAQHDVRDVAEAHQRAALLTDDEPAKVLDRFDARRGREVELDEGALGLADGREVVVRGERLPHLRRADVQRGHAFGLQPGAQREGASAQDVRLLHALDRRQPRLHDADEVVGHLVVLKDLRVEAEVHRRERGVRRLEADGRHLGLGGQSPRTWFTRALMSASARAVSTFSWR